MPARLELDDFHSMRLRPVLRALDKFIMGKIATGLLLREGGLILP